MKLFFRIVLFFITSVIFIQVPAFSQTKISGIVGDSLGNRVSSASVSLIRLQDSSLVTFYLTGDDGYYEFTKIPAGRYRIHATHMSYHSQVKTVEVVAGQPELKLEPFALNNHDLVIDGGVIVADIPPVMLRGDTLEFNAGSFHTAPNSVVEDLLKKIPGLEIATDGTITVNGQQVNKVLVDGKEFFGTDPRLATRNLPAEAVDKVQVYDDKNDAEQVTGTSDGQTDMTLNLKLKEDHKKGVFGTLGGGYGTNQRWQAKASLNAFRKNAQFNFISNGNNINEAVFSFRELMSLTGQMDDRMSGGNVSIQMDDNDMGFPIAKLLSAQSQGLNTQVAGGVRAAQSWGEKLTLSGSYLATWFKPNLIENTKRKYFLPDSSYNYTNNSSQTMNILNHRFQGSLIWKPETKTTLRIKPAFSIYGMNADIANITQNRSENNFNGSDATNNQINHSNSWNFTNDLRFTHGFQRKGRSISTNWNLSLNQSDSKQTLDNLTSFLHSDSTFAGQALKQRWFTAADQQNTTLKVAYTEPFFNRWLLEVNVNGGYVGSTNAREAFAWNFTELAYTDSVPQLSNDFNAAFVYGAGGLQFRRAGKKMSFAFGSDYQQSRLTGSIVQKNFSVERHFRQFLPNGRIQYSFTKFKELTINYRTRLQPPSVTQLQPLRNVSNPLYIETGNPSLNPQTNHSVEAQLRLINPTKRRFIVLFLNGTLFQNAIADSKSIDSLGITTVAPVNVKGNWNMNGRILFDIPVKKLKSTLNFEPQVSANRTRNFVNEIANPALTISITPSLEWTFNPTDSFEISLHSDYRWGQSSYAIGTTSYFSNWKTGADLLWILPKGFTLTSGFNWSQIKGNGTTTSYPLWSASVSKLFLKGNRGEIKVSAFDMLRQNIGVSQNTLAAYTESLQYNTLTRYVMLSLTYRLTNYVPGQRGGNREIHVIRE